MTLLVEEADRTHVARIFAEDWVRALEREGLEPVTPTNPAPFGEEAEPPCPACGFSGPLVAGACSDCGLMLG